MKTTLGTIFSLAAGLAFAFLAASPAMAQSCTETCSWYDAAGWGKAITCQNTGIAFGICGSGSNMDCTGSSGPVAAKAYCCQIPNAGQPSDSTTLSGSWGQRLECADGQVVQAYCGSGRNKDCPNDSSTQIKCSTLSGVQLTGASSWYSTKDWGKDLTCPNATVMTGACGSGSNKDCPDGTTNEIKCTTYTLK